VCALTRHPGHDIHTSVTRTYICHTRRAAIHKQPTRMYRPRRHTDYTPYDTREVPVHPLSDLTEQGKTARARAPMGEGGGELAIIWLVFVRRPVCRRTTPRDLVIQVGSAHVRHPTCLRKRPHTSPCMVSVTCE